MSADQHIVSSAVINNGVVWKNGNSLFESRGEMPPEFLVSAYRSLNLQYPKFFKMDTLSKLGWITAEILLQEEGLRDNYGPADIGVVLSNASASLDTDIRYYETVKSMPSPALFVYTLPNIMIGEICIRNQIKGENAFFVFEQFDANFIREYVEGLFESGSVSICICGWVELLHEACRSVMYLVKKRSDMPVENQSGAYFTNENLIKIYQCEHG